jgi:hypothetical protein
MFAVLLGILIFFQYGFHVTIVGFQSASGPQLGTLGEYLGRLFEETKRRPIYLLRKRINCKS